MIGISTVWRSKRTDDGGELVDMMLESGINHIELEYRIPEQMYQQMKPALKQGVLQVLSVHNFFPVPDVFPQRDMGGGDAFLFSSLDANERGNVVKYASRTIEIANELEAKAVVLHLGGVKMGNPMKHLFQLYDEGKIETPEGKRIVSETKNQRLEKRQPFLDAVLFCLDKVHKVAERQNIILGIENRYHVDNIPDLEEMGEILRRFEGGNLRFWHDVGHAFVQEKLGWADHRQLLERYGKGMFGLHLHDVRGGYDDHYAPGSGGVDFQMVKDYLPADVIKIMEVKHEVSLEELKEGIDFLHRMGIE